jgi:hypothetical protein
VGAQYPRPCITSICDPERARVFIIGYNQATPLLVEQVGAMSEDHDAYLDALFNRNGKSIRSLLAQIRGEKGPSRTRKNIEKLRSGLAELGIDDVIETNAICFGTPMAIDLADETNKDGRKRGIKLFYEILRIIRPKILIVHGAGTAKALRGVLSPQIPKPASKQTDGVSCARVAMQSTGKPYAPMVFVIPSLAPPRWNAWQNWAGPHLAETCSLTHKFLDGFSGA